MKSGRLASAYFIVLMVFILAILFGVIEFQISVVPTR
jgi:hypothetical protein